MWKYDVFLFGYKHEKRGYFGGLSFDHGYFGMEMNGVFLENSREK
jgi:hypothetical protein